ncbi:MAG: hypothetical protein ACRC2R_27000 [Xenococcaceae cyanobacterium]
MIAKYQGKRKGIKLGDENVLPIEMFSRATQLLKQAELGRNPRRKVGQIRIFQDTRDRWNQIFEQIVLSGNQQEKSEKLLEWIEAKLAQSEITQEEQPSLTPEDKGSLISSSTPIPDELSEHRESKELTEDVTSPQVVTASTATTTDDPLRQDIQQLIGAIANLVSLQQAALSHTVSNVRPKRKTVVSSLPISKADSTDGTGITNSNGRVKASMQDSQRLIDTWIEAIMNYNNATDRRHDEKWAITISLLKSVGGSQPRIVKTLQQRPDLVEHHKLHQLDPDRHNLKHRGKHKISELIQINAIDS